MKLTLSDLTGWFADRGWKPFRFQKEVWKAIADGESGLLHATTGSGKTYAVWLGALRAFPLKATPSSARPNAKIVSPPLTVLWITPMRALAADTLRAQRQPLEVLAPDWTSGARSGDTAATERSAQNRQLPTVLVTTPESLSVLLSRADAAEVLGTVRMVVVDEWHELMGNKRGVQVQLAIARLKRWNPALCVWGMSATLGNLAEGMRTLLGHDGGTMVQGQVKKDLVVDSLLPGHAERFPWGGHLGMAMLPQVVREIETSATTLVFANTRAQSEIWYRALLEARPEWAGVIALHHGSLDRAVREWVEAGLKSGELRAVVCTSSLDLGVDFLPVERVLQIGSPKGVARDSMWPAATATRAAAPSTISRLCVGTSVIREGRPGAWPERPARCSSRATPLGEPICSTRSTGRKSTPRSRLEVHTTARRSPLLSPASTHSRAARSSEPWCRAITPAHSGRASSRARYQISDCARVLAKTSVVALDSISRTTCGSIAMPRWPPHGKRSV